MMVILTRVIALKTKYSMEPLFFISRVLTDVDFQVADTKSTTLTPET